MECCGVGVFLCSTNPHDYDRLGPTVVARDRTLHGFASRRSPVDPAPSRKSCSGAIPVGPQQATPQLLQGLSSDEERVVMEGGVFLEFDISDPAFRTFPSPIRKCPRTPPRNPVDTDQN